MGQTDARLARIRRSRLQQLISERFGGVAARLSEGLGGHPSAAQLTQWKSGDRNLSEATARDLERRLALPRGWLDFDAKTTRQIPIAKDLAEIGAGGNVSSAPAPSRISGMVPLISWERAGQWSDVSSALHSENVIEWVPAPASAGDSAFAVQVVGDSMTNPSDRRSLADGAVVIIDPERAARHGSIVLARRFGDEAACLRLLWFDGQVPYLKPLNDAYALQPLPAGSRIIGVAVALSTSLL